MIRSSICFWVLLHSGEVSASRTFVCRCPMGGQSESRLLALMQRECHTVRQVQCLPTLEAGVDARFVLDEGRHNRILGKAHKTAVTSFDWLLVVGYFARYRTRVLAQGSCSQQSLFSVFGPNVAGMVQGLPPSTILDSSFPRELQEWVGLLYSPVVSLSWLCYVMSNMWIFQLLGVSGAQGPCLGPKIGAHLFVCSRAWVWSSSS